jgi:undecaprenyl-diphosphatase
MIAIASLVAFAALTVAVGLRFVFPFDAPLLAAALTMAGWKTFWEFMSQTANFPLIATAIVTVLWLIRQKRHREAVLVIVMLVAVTAGSEGVKQLTGRDRPSGSGDGIPGVVYSYPSGHVLEAMTILGLLVVRAWRSSRSLVLRLTFAGIVAIEVGLVAVARLALNTHYPTDLLAGVLGSLAALALYAWFTRDGGWADVPAAHAPAGETRATGPRQTSPRAKEAAG